MMANPITYRTALEIASHEAIIRQAYKDSVGRRTPIGQDTASSMRHPVLSRL
jgi:hypothetical protein